MLRPSQFSSQSIHVQVTSCRKTVASHSGCWMLPVKMCKIYLSLYFLIVPGFSQVKTWDCNVFDFKSPVKSSLIGRWVEGGALLFNHLTNSSDSMLLPCCHRLHCFQSWQDSSRAAVISGKERWWLNFFNLPTWFAVWSWQTPKPFHPAIHYYLQIDIVWSVLCCLFF